MTAPNYDALVLGSRAPAKICDISGEQSPSNASLSAPVFPPRAWRARDGALPRDARIHTTFAEWVERAPDAPAVIQGERMLSYRELDERANRLAWFLRGRGVGPGVAVALCTERSAELVVGQLGILKAGGVFVPIDAGYPAERVHFILADTGARLLLTQRSARASLPELGIEVVCLEDDWPAIARQRADAPPCDVTGDSPAYLVYTSGSTGRPKGSALPHRGVVRLVAGQDYLSFRPGDRILAVASPGFDGIIFEVWGPLLSGGACVLFPDRWPEVSRLETVIRTHGVTGAFLTTSLFNQIVDVHPQALAPLREILIGGEALSVAHIRRALELLPGVALSNVYGPTECTAFACVGRIGPPDEWGCATVPIGRPLNHTECHIVDAALQPVPVGEPGELLLGGAGLAHGYLNRPELTAEKFVRHPWSDDPEARLYRTGDRCRWLPDGRIEYLGRMDEQIKLRGFRIEPGEIEAAAREQLGVANAAVLARELPDGRKQLVVFVVPQAGAAVSPERVLAGLRARLPEPLVPARLETIDRLPLTPNGKVDRRALAARLAASDEAAPAKPDMAVPAAGGLEERLVAIYRRLLGRPAGPHTDFFREGGDSLLAVRLAVEVERETGRPLPVGTIFAHPTPAALARRVEETSGSGALPGLQGSGPGPVLVYVPALHGIGRLPPGLAERLRGVCRYYEGLQLPGLDGAGRPIDRVEDLAAALVAQVQAVYPEGPLRLFGISFGGLLAYEMARQFAMRGRPVAQVIIGDSASVELQRWRGRWERTALLLFDVIRPPWRDVPVKLRRIGGWIGSQVTGKPPDEKRTPVEAASLYAYERYRPEPYAGRVELLRCPGVLFSAYRKVEDLPDHGWSARVTGKFTLHRVKCRHRDLFRGHANDTVCAILAAD